MRACVVVVWWWRGGVKDKGLRGFEAREQGGEPDVTDESRVRAWMEGRRARKGGGW